MAKYAVHATKLKKCTNSSHFHIKHATVGETGENWDKGELGQWLQQTFLWLVG